MKRIAIAHTCAVVFTLAGCGPATLEPPPKALPSPSASLPAPRVSPQPTVGVTDVRDAPPAEISADTERDLRFGEFVRKAAGGMVKKVAVGIERKNVLRVELGEATAPEDTLPLTKSLLSGARKDFPNQPITVSVYDPSGEPILKALYRPEEGVRYEVAHAKDSSKRFDSAAEAQAGTSAATRAIPRGALSEKDRKFADWAMSKGGDYLRYVEADLDRRGRLWFGITREVKPEDVPALTKSLLEGARTEFPRRELTATVFDPDGEKIGKATLGADGDVHWVR